MCVCVPFPHRFVPLCFQPPVLPTDLVSCSASGGYSVLLHAQVLLIVAGTHSVMSGRWGPYSTECVRVTEPLKQT